MDQHFLLMRVKFDPKDSHSNGALSDEINGAMDHDGYELRTMTYLPETKEMLVAYRVAEHRR